MLLTVPANGRPAAVPLTEAAPVDDMIEREGPLRGW
jgi:hypothetical protein